MKQAIKLYNLIEKVKDKLKTENIDFNDYDKAVIYLKKYPTALEIYETYINY